MKQYITANAFKKSIVAAFQYKNEFTSSLKSVRGALSQANPGTLNACENHGIISFRKYENGRQHALRRSSAELYPLARKRYLECLCGVLEPCCAMQGNIRHGNSALWDRRQLGKVLRERDAALQNLLRLIDLFDKGNLDIARIVMSQKQYNWYTKPFVQKAPPENSLNVTNGGIITRSKSEKEIGNALEDWGAFYHFEERLQINVYNLVKTLEAQVREQNKRNGNRHPARLFYYEKGVCYWNVPPELQWMNAPGSVWKTYNSRTGMITMHNDFRFMPADNSIMVMEHEGMMEDFKYRSNASERAALLKYTGAVSGENVLETYERDTGDSGLIEDIIKRGILPRLWF